MNAYHRQQQRKNLRIQRAKTEILLKQQMSRLQAHVKIMKVMHNLQHSCIKDLSVTATVKAA
jgi:predicted transport protein